MHKIDSQSASLTSSPAMLEPAHWLIVLVPSVEADLSAATRRVWELANAAGRRVLFIGLYDNAAQELGLRRQLVNMSAMVDTAGIYTETQSVSSRDYLRAVRSRFHDGDMVICFAGQRSHSNKLLSDVLSVELNVPVYILSSPVPQKLPGSYWLTQMTAWGGSVAIIAGFFLLQVRIDQMKPDGFHLIVLLVSIGLEFWMIWVWNILFK